MLLYTTDIISTVQRSTLTSFPPKHEVQSINFNICYCYPISMGNIITNSIRMTAINKNANIRVRWLQLLDIHSTVSMSMWMHTGNWLKNLSFLTVVSA